MRSKVYETFSGIMGVKPDALDDAMSPETLAAWDSFKHMNLVMALEDDFGIRLSDDDVVAMLSLGDIVDVVNQRLEN